MQPNNALHLQTTAVIILVSTLSPSLAAHPDENIEVIPIARYVSEESKLRGYSEFNASVAAGTAQYDSTFRHPFLPLGRLVVDCRKVGRVGVTLAVTFSEFHNSRVGNRYPKSLSKDTTIEYIWFHSEHSKKGGRYFSKFRVPANRRMKMISYGMTLREIDRVDGMLSIDILVNSELIYQTSFELVGCEKST